MKNANIPLSCSIAFNIKDFTKLKTRFFIGFSIIEVQITKQKTMDGNIVVIARTLNHQLVKRPVTPNETINSAMLNIRLRDMATFEKHLIPKSALYNVERKIRGA